MKDGTPIRGSRFLWLWALGCMVVSAAVTLPLALNLRNAGAETRRVQDARMDPNVPDIGLYPPHTEVPNGVIPMPVEVGVYVERIPEISLPGGYWLADFNLWFRWRGDSFDPDGFEVLDGWIEERTLEDQFTRGDEHYAIYLVHAKISKSWDVSRFPRDDYQLLIAIEHPRYQHHEVRFIADETGSALSSRARVPGYHVTRDQAISKPHSYRSRRGDPRLPEDHVATYSQFRYAFEIVRPGFGVYFRMFQMLFVASGVALLSLLVGAHDIRFLLGVGAMFAAVANSYVVNSMIPDTGHATLADMTSLLNVGLIAATMVQSTISIHLHRDRDEVALSRRFDKVSFWVLTALFIGTNLVLLRAAGVG